MRTICENFPPSSNDFNLFLSLRQHSYLHIDVQFVISFALNKIQALAFPRFMMSIHFTVTLFCTILHQIFVLYSSISIAHTQTHNSVCIVVIISALYNMFTTYFNSKLLNWWTHTIPKKKKLTFCEINLNVKYTVIVKASRNANIRASTSFYSKIHTARAMRNTKQCKVLNGIV